jgi:hypothetical protein
MKKDFRSLLGGSSVRITTALFINVHSFMLSHEEARFSPYETAEKVKNVHDQCCFGNRRMSNRGVDVFELWLPWINLFPVVAIFSSLSQIWGRYH